MARSRPLRPVLGTLAALLTAALSVAGCVSVPTGGPVQSYPVTQGTDAQSQQYMQIQPQPPGQGWDPKQIVEGFLTASASFGNYSQVVQQYLTPSEQKDWKPNWSADVYKYGPNVGSLAYSPNSKSPTTATVEVAGTIQASLAGSSSYSVRSASSQGAQFYPPPPFQLQKVGGQWRISSAPQELLLTSNSFQHDYQLQNLYFFDPTSSYLVPDPVYVPLVATQEELVNGLVSDLITPPHDWLAEGATKTAFPAGTKIGGVTLSGVTAVVNLKGASITKATSKTMAEVSAQLLSTLHGAAQGGPNGAVQSVEVLRNGNPWIPPNGQDNPVQQPPMYANYNPPTGESNTFYYVDSLGYLTSFSTGGPARRLAKIGTGFTQIAVSPDGQYVAALRGQTLYGGVVGGQLLKRGSGYVTISWDPSDHLWASTGDQIVMFRGVKGVQQPLGQMVLVNVSPIAAPYTQLRVAPDGVRMAIIEGDNVLTFGAISGQQGPNPQISLSTVQDDPLGNASFAAVTWYGPDDVITLATPGSAVTEYPISGGSPTTVPTDSNMLTIAASYKQPLIGGLLKGQMAADASLTGSWMPIPDGDTLVSGSLPAYPG